MSQYPRRVLASGSVTWGQTPAGVPMSTFVRAGTIVDVKPGSTLEAAYAGIGLSGVLPVSAMGDEQNLDKGALSN